MVNIVPINFLFSLSEAETEDRIKEVVGCKGINLQHLIPNKLLVLQQLI